MSHRHHRGAGSMRGPSFVSFALAVGLLHAAPSYAALIGTGGFGLIGQEGANIGPTTVASFTDTDPSQPVSDYSATIDWGDGTASSGTIVAGPSGGFEVFGAHTYAEEGSYIPDVTIVDTDGASTTVRDASNVADAPLSLTRSAPLTGVEGAP